MNRIIDNYWLKFGLILLGMMALVGCSDDASQSQPGSGVQKGGAFAVSQATGDANLSVTLTPAVATTNTEISAIAGGNPSIFSFEWQINGGVVQGNSTNRLAAENFVKGDRISVSMVTDKSTVTAATEIANSPPRILATSFVEPRLYNGIDIVIAAKIVDADQDPVTVRYTWMLNGEVVSSHEENRLPGKLLQRGDRVSFIAIPSDGETDGPPYVTNEFVIPNGAPRFVTSYPLQFSNFTYSYSARAEDPDGDPLLYLLESGPAGMTIDPQSGELYWEIKTSQGGEHRVKIIAQDTEGLQATQEFSLTVKIPE